MVLFLYRLLSAPIAGALFFVQKKWIRVGKEDPLRAQERWGKTNARRSQNHRLVWFHAASVGESVALIDVIRKLLNENSDWQVLITTFTRTSAKIMADSLPEGAVHQMVPLEHTPSIRRFLKHWQPDLVVWTESDIWPLILSEIHRKKIPTVMVNGVISERSYNRLKRFRGSIKKLLSPFETGLIKDQEALDRYRELGLANGNLRCVGSLKEATLMAEVDAPVFNQVQAAINRRPVWLAGSTHPNEFPQIVATHKILLKSYPDMLLIHAPRHPENAALVRQSSGAEGWKIAQRSLGELPSADCEVFLADTIGEMRLWHQLSPISFIGGSLSADRGHNPFEAAALGSAILYGPSVEHFGEVYQRYSLAGAAIQVSNAVDLAENIIKLQEPDYRRGFTAAASKVRFDGAGAFTKTYSFLQQRLDKFDAP
ncbi:MAG: 3-deoxy-D-manno-octulosonic acid transferase [Rhodobacteraceae bacterium]|nr:3-deoxy-D-manno-octulosonic acid transferase [Paracoccaceae bacterium]